MSAWDERDFEGWPAARGYVDLPDDIGELLEHTSLGTHDAVRHRRDTPPEVKVEVLARLSGDGVTDDTTAIQAAVDAGHFIERRPGYAVRQHPMAPYEDVEGP